MEARIRAVRKHVGQTQPEFGARLGVSRAVIASYEGGKVTPPELVLRAIVREFKVDYGWLKDGIGEMFSSEEDEILAALDDMLQNKDEKGKNFIRKLVRLNDSQLDTLDAVLDALLREHGH